MSTYQFNGILTLVLAMAFIAIHQINGQLDFQYEMPPKRQESSTAHQYCGKHLSSALQLLCNGVYNSMFKKSGQGKTLKKFITQLHNIIITVTYIFLFLLKFNYIFIFHNI